MSREEEKRTTIDRRPGERGPPSRLARKMDHMLAGPTEQVTKRFCELVRAGYGIRHAANILGITPGRLRQWMNPDDDAGPKQLAFVSQVQGTLQSLSEDRDKVNRIAKAKLLEVIQGDDDHLSARYASWLLERTDPEFLPKAKQEVDARLTHDVSQMSNAELERRIRELEGGGAE